MTQEALSGGIDLEWPASAPRPPICFQPPHPLTWTPELWVVTTGPRDEGQWGGAEVAWSEEGPDGDHYNGPFRIGADAVAGTLLDDWAVGGPIVRVAADDAGEMATVDEGAAARCQSLLYIGDGRRDYELVAFTGMTLCGKTAEGAHVYALSGRVRRGLYGTTVRTHRAGSRFAWLNGDVARIPLPHRLLAARARLYLKIAGINACGSTESLPEPADLEPIAIDLAWEVR